MGFNWLHKHRAPHHIFVSADNDTVRIPHRFILQNVRANYYKEKREIKDLKLFILKR